MITEVRNLSPLSVICKSKNKSWLCICFSIVNFKLGCYWFRKTKKLSGSDSTSNWASQSNYWSKISHCLWCSKDSNMSNFVVLTPLKSCFKCHKFPISKNNCNSYFLINNLGLLCQNLYFYHLIVQGEARQVTIIFYVEKVIWSYFVWIFIRNNYQNITNTHHKFSSAFWGIMHYI